MNERFDRLIDSYILNKVGIDNNLISPALSAGLHQNIIRLQKDERMMAAGIGNEKLKDSAQEMRGDTIHWLDKKHDNAYEQEYLKLVEDLIGYLNSTCYTGINAYEFHYAMYEPGSFYKRHKDQFRNDDQRKFSLISYLNAGWQDEDGGALLVYPEDGVQKIFPHAQTGVFFKSDEMEHEVTVASRTRMSITGWLKQV